MSHNSTRTDASISVISKRVRMWNFAYKVVFWRFQSKYTCHGRFQSDQVCSFEFELIFHWYICPILLSNWSGLKCYVAFWITSSATDGAASTNRAPSACKYTPRQRHLNAILVIFLSLCLLGDHVPMWSKLARFARISDTFFEKMGIQQWQDERVNWMRYCSHFWPYDS